MREEMRSIGSTIGAITEGLFELASKERQLAQAEIADSMSAARRSATYGAVAAVLGLFMLGFLALSLMYGLDTVMPQWLAALATAGIIALVAAVVAFMAKRALADFTIMPKRTAQSVKEDLQWASAQIKRNGTSPPSESSSASASRN
jgi:protein-S-isoprenylcysteine O-methyltransferase Ste14